MKKLFTLIFLASIVFGANAQLVFPYDFEEGQADTGWIIFANGADGSQADLSIVQNPFADNTNSSDSVLQFIVHDDANPWVGMYTDYQAEMYFTQEAHTIGMMVMKDVISPLRIKLEISLNGGEILSIEIPNTVTDEWEALTFEFTEAIDYLYKRLTIFVDFPAERISGCTAYLDNIVNITENTSVSKDISGELLRIFPNPVENRMAVQFPQMTSIKVSNVLGKTIKTLSFPEADSKVLELGDLQSGYYFVSVESNSGSHSLPFIKK